MHLLKEIAAVIVEREPLVIRWGCVVCVGCGGWRGFWLRTHDLQLRVYLRGRRDHSNGLRQGWDGRVAIRTHWESLTYSHWLRQR